MASGERDIPEAGYWQEREAAAQEWRSSAAAIEAELAAVDIDALEAERAAGLAQGDPVILARCEAQISDYHARQREASAARELAEEAAALRSREILQEREARFRGILDRIPYPEMRAMLASFGERLSPFLTSDEVGERVVAACTLYHRLEAQTTFDPENLGRHLHTETIQELQNWYQAASTSREFLGSGERLNKSFHARVEAARFQEMLAAILSTEQPDLRDLDFVFDIASTNNKFLRTTALKKAVEVYRSFPESVRKVPVGGRELTPSLTQQYAALDRPLPRRDFLFTLPLVAKDGVIQEPLLEAVQRYQTTARLRRGSSDEALYFAAAVDLYDARDPDAATPVLEALEREYRFRDSAYGQRLARKNQERGAAGKRPLDRYLHFGELRRAYEEMKQQVVAEKDPTAASAIADLPGEERAEYLEAYFRDIWRVLSREEQRVFWDAELADTIQELEEKDLSTAEGFEDVLRKLGAIRVLDPSEFAYVLERPAANTQELNRQADEAQLALFRHHFALNNHDRATLPRISNLSPDASLESLDDQLPAAYRRMKNFTPFFLLLQRYRSEDVVGLEPEVFRKHLTSLLRELTYHMVKGDFREWRAGIRRSIVGNPLEYKEGDREFWDLWNRDDETTAFDHSPLFRLERAVRSSIKGAGAMLNDPDRFLLSPLLWKDSVVQASMRRKRGETFDPEQVAARLAAAQEFPEKDRAQRSRLRKIQTAIRSLRDLGALLRETQAAEEKGQVEDSGLRLLRLELALRNIQVDEFLRRPDRNVRGGAQAEFGYQFLKDLQQLVGTWRRLREARERQELSVVDSSDMYDLIRAGQPSHEILNCMSYEGDPRKNALLLDICTSKNKKVCVVKLRGRPVARAILKILRTDPKADANPIIEIDDLLVEKGTEGIYDYREEIREHLRKKFRGRPDVRIAEGAHDSDRRLERLRELKILLETKRLTAEQLTEDERLALEAFRENVELAWGTGSRVSAEMVETAASGMQPQPYIKIEPKNPRHGGPPSAFYRHFVRFV